MFLWTRTLKYALFFVCCIAGISYSVVQLSQPPSWAEVQIFGVNSVAGNLEGSTGMELKAVSKSNPEKFRIRDDGILNFVTYPIIRTSGGEGMLHLADEKLASPRSDQAGTNTEEALDKKEKSIAEETKFNLERKKDRLEGDKKSFEIAKQALVEGRLEMAEGLIWETTIRLRQEEFISSAMRLVQEDGSIKEKDQNLYENFMGSAEAIGLGDYAKADRLARLARKEITKRRLDQGMEMLHGGLEALDKKRIGIGEEAKYNLEREKDRLEGDLKTLEIAKQALAEGRLEMAEGLVRETTIRLQQEDL